MQKHCSARSLMCTSYFVWHYFALIGFKMRWITLHLEIMKELPQIFKELLFVGGSAVLAYKTSRYAVSGELSGRCTWAQWITRGWGMLPRDGWDKQADSWEGERAGSSVSAAACDCMWEADKKAWWSSVCCIQTFSPSRSKQDIWVFYLSKFVYICPSLLHCKSAYKLLDTSISAE